MIHDIAVLHKAWNPFREKERPADLVTREQWGAFVADFPSIVRGRAANLAAHNYDVVLIDDRLLIATGNGGAWFDKDGTQTDLTAGELDTFYPRVPDRTPEGKLIDMTRSDTCKIYPQTKDGKYAPPYYRRYDICLDHLYWETRA